MKIGSSHDVAPLDSGVRPQRAGGAATDHAVAPAGDQVALSAAGSALVKGGGADFDHAKVEQIRSAIKDGRFTVNAGAIADALIADAAALLRPRHS
jgi:negative regulator of flagellin synthesis FlgM